MEGQQPDRGDVPQDTAAPSRTITQEDLDEYGIEVSCPPEAIPALMAAAASVHDIPSENAALARAIANSQEYNSEDVQDEGERWGRKKKAVVLGAGAGAVVVVSILGVVVYRLLRGSRGKKSGHSRSAHAAGAARGSRCGLALPHALGWSDSSHRVTVMCVSVDTTHSLYSTPCHSPFVSRCQALCKVAGYCLFVCVSAFM